MTTDYLFAQPSARSGAARILDLFGRFDIYNTSETAQEADLRALRADYRVVREDLRRAFVQMMTENPAFARELEEILRLDPVVAEQLRLIESSRKNSPVHEQEAQAS